jgi:gluconolactonase
VGISPDMATVYVADTIEARLYAFARELKKQTPRLHATVPGKVSLDSLAITSAGNVCVATIGETGSISTVTAEGAISSTPTGDRVTTNIAFGGPDMRSAWITYSMQGLLMKLRWREAGLKLVYQ